MRCLNATDFVPARPPVVLKPDEIQLWLRIAPGEGRESSGRWLRALLAGHLGCAVDAVRLERGEHGKPHLVAPGALEFNLSHSAGAALVGISRRQPLGVDVESGRRRRPIVELARRFFSPEEAEALARLAPDRRRTAFLRLWSCKEAVVKALGRGLGFGLNRVAFELDAVGNPAGLNVIDSSAGGIAEWHIVRVARGTELSGALAWRGPPCPVRAFSVLEP